MRPFFSSGGGVRATVEAVRGRPAVAPCVLGFDAGEEESWPVGPCGWAGPAGRLRPSGKGRENRPVKKKKDWAERPDGLKVTGKILFRIKFDF
jgi:hypothetical protein